MLAGWVGGWYGVVAEAFWVFEKARLCVQLSGCCLISGFVIRRIICSQPFSCTWDMGEPAQWTALIVDAQLPSSRMSRP